MTPWYIGILPIVSVIALSLFLIFFRGGPLALWGIPDLLFSPSPAELAIDLSVAEIRSGLAVSRLSPQLELAAGMIEAKNGIERVHILIRVPH